MNTYYERCENKKKEGHKSVSWLGAKEQILVNMTPLACGHQGALEKQAQEGTPCPKL